MQREIDTLSSIISGPMRSYMNRIDAAARFLLILKPGVTKVAFVPAYSRSDKSYDIAESDIKAALIAMDEAFHEQLTEIRQQGQQAIAKLSSARDLFHRCYELVVRARRINNALQLDTPLVGIVAGRWLQQSTLLLGDVPKKSGASENRWRTTPARAAQLRFQDALDWRAEFHSSLADAKEKEGARFDGYRELGLVGRPTIMMAPRSIDRPNMVTLSNLKIFLAEHLLAYVGKSIDPLPLRNPGMMFFFQPLKGLGQHRAAIDWVAIDCDAVPSHRTEADLSFQSSRFQVAAVESLFTQSLLNAFSHALREEIANFFSGSVQAVGNIRLAFADLWWATEVRFIRHGHAVQCLMRGEGVEDDGWKIVSREPEKHEPHWLRHDDRFPGFFAVAGDGHPSVTYIQLDLSALIQAGVSAHPMVAAGLVKEREVYEVLNSWSFDKVVFACHFFRIRRDDFAEWVDRLGEIILDAILEQATLPLRGKVGGSIALQDTAHWLNSLVRVADRTETSKKVERVIDGLDASDHRDDLLVVRNRLELLLLLEAGVGLMRLIGTLANEEYPKLKVWFTRHSLAEWNQPAAFEKYCVSVTHFARAIASAFGRPSVKVNVNGKVTLYSEACSLDLDEIRFPPLSKQEKEHEPVLAILPALTEPLTNALRYLQKWPDDTSPIELKIEDCRKAKLPHILVKIGNGYHEKEGERISPSGLEKASRLMNVVKLASIDENYEYENRDGAFYFWVSVRLHPQLLYEEIK